MDEGLYFVKRVNETTIKFAKSGSDLYNGKFINSQKLKLPSGKILKDEERKLFEIERIKLDVEVAELRN